MKELTSTRHRTLTNEKRFLSLPVINHHGGLVIKYLFSIKETLDLSLNEYRRVYVQRVDLRYPKFYLNYNGCTITRFIESLKSKIKNDLRRKGKIGECNMRYVWVKEQNTSVLPHYHLALFFNRDIYYCPGNYQHDYGNLSSMIKEAWASALGLDCFEVNTSIHFPENSIYYVSKSSANFLDEYKACFYRLSYLAKVDTKVYASGLKNFSTSRK
jgi:hypothetical protein